ncbi:MAG TPA: phytanoyl-CoA dioxygenase family protein [Planctomycetota bacterium]|nr:phytanoyl-CoA dioxygenase family protein [Planctomycetota bacterium]
MHRQLVVGSDPAVSDPELGECRAALQDDGYFIRRNAVPRETIAALREALSRLLEPEGRPGETVFETIVRLHRGGDKALYRLHELSKDLAAMNSLRQTCAAWAAALLGPDRLLLDVNSHVIFSIPDDDRSMWSWHQESSYDVFEGDGINFCVPVFEPATRENGTMSLLKGSHKLGPLPFDKQRPENGSTTLLPRGIEQLVADREEVHFIAEPGDLIGFDRDLVHRSNRNRSPRPRVTAVVQFAVIDRIPESMQLPY